MLMLPEPIIQCPREKPCPEPKEETRWEKFAREKGITKRKRERMVWDKDTETWRPRFGYKRDGEIKDWVIPLKKTDPDTIDKYEEKRLTKKGKVLKNELNRIRNMDKAAAKRNKGKQKNVVKIPSGIPTALEVKRPLKGNSERAKKSKRGMEAALSSLNQVQVSTASMGQFDAAVAGEGRKGRGTKRQYIDNQKNTKTRDMELLALTLSGNLPPDRKKLKNAPKRQERGVARKGGKGRKKSRR